MAPVSSALEEIGDDVESGSVPEPMRSRVERDENVDVVVREYQEDVDTLNKKVEFWSKQTSAMQDLGGVLFDVGDQTWR